MPCLAWLQLGLAPQPLPTPAPAPTRPCQILDRADPTNTNVYVGNLAPQLTDAEVRRHFGAFGPVAEVKLYRKGSYG